MPLTFAEADALFRQDRLNEVPCVTYIHGVTGVFLDPPYSVEDRCSCYGKNEDFAVAKDVWQWCMENGDDPRFQIALCGYEGQYDMPDSWECVAWKANGGFGVLRYKINGKGRSNRFRERVWFSPTCRHNSEDALLL